MKKQLSILLLSLALLFSFTACEGDGKKANDNTENKEVESQENQDDKSSDEDNEAVSVIEVDSDTAKTLIKDNNAILVDVRTEEEFDEKHIDGAILMPYDEIENLISSKIEDKESYIIVYCRSGRRSGIAAETLVDMGYKHIYDLGAMSSWQE